MRRRKSRISWALLAVVALALGACSESTTPPDDVTDTTVPFIVGTTPTADAIQVSTNAFVQIVFNEDMDAASAVGQVALSSGGTATVLWLDDRTFQVQHSLAWTPGTQVTVTVGAGLKDVAGNALAAPHTFSFFTETSDLVLVTTDPEDGATGVNRSASLRLQFSLRPDLASVIDQVTIADATTKAQYPFTASDGGGNGWVLLDPENNLPAATLIDVTIGAGVHAEQSPLNTLGEGTGFQFTTGVDVDTAPPTIVSFSPASGTFNIAPDIGSLVITFSEAINPETFEPSRWNVEFVLAFEDGGTEPVWTQGNTVLTVGLPTLPAGLEMEVTFDDYADPSGNVQTAATVWSTRVAGTADIFPMAEGIRHYLTTYWSRGLAGSDVPTESGGPNEDYRQIEPQLNGNVRLVDYETAEFSTPRHWDTYARLSTAINWLGFADSDGGEAPSEITFDTPVKFLPLPIAAGTWTGNTTVTVPGEGTYDAVLTGHVIGREDLPLDLKVGEPPRYYKGAWKVARSMEVTLGGEWYITMSDTTWYSPTFGPVREISAESFAARGDEPAGWYRSSSWRDPGGFGPGK